MTERVEFFAGTVQYERADDGSVVVLAHAFTRSVPVTEQIRAGHGSGLACRKGRGLVARVVAGTVDAGELGVDVAAALDEQLF